MEEIDKAVDAVTSLEGSSLETRPLSGEVEIG
jgi:hypothetical protein